MMVITESPFGELIRDDGHDWLPCWFAAAQCMETDLVCSKVHVGADQTMRPRTVYDKGVSE